MRTLVESGDRADVLDRFCGADARIWLYDISLKRIVLRLTRSDLQDALHVVGVGCAHIVAHFSWSNASISFVEEESANETRIIDQAAGFELICNTSALILTPANEGFDDFSKPVHRRDTSAG